MDSSVHSQRHYLMPLRPRVPLTDRGHAVRLRAWLLATLLVSACPGGVAEAMGTHPRQDASALYEEAQALVEGGAYRNALVTLKNALQQDPEHLPARVLLGQVLLQLGDAAGAEKELVWAKRAGADPRLVVLPLGRAYLAMGNADAVLAQVQPGGLSGAEAGEAHWLRGQAHFMKGEVDQADLSYELAGALRPDDVNPVFGRAQVALARRDYARARDWVAAALDRAPAHVDAWALQAELKRREGDWPAAISAYSRVLELAPDHQVARIARATLLLEQGALEPALADITVARQRDPSDPRAAYLHAMALTQTGNPASARDLLRGALGRLDGIPPQVLHADPDLLLLAGTGHFANQNFEKARLHLARLLELVPEHRAARKLLATIALAEGDAAAAIRVLEPVASGDTTDAELLVLLGDAYARRRLHSAALNAFQRAASLEPERSGLHTRMALTRLAGGEREVALQELQRSVAADPQAGYVLGRLRLESGDAQAALETAANLIQSHPAHPAGYQLAGTAHALRGDLRAARESFEQAARVDPAYVPAQLDLATIDLKEGRLHEARERYDQLLARAPDQRAAMIGLARVAEVEGDAEEAVRRLEQAQGTGSLAPREALWLADLHLRSGRPRVALEQASAVAASVGSSVEAYDVVGRAQLASGKPTEAVATFRKLYALVGDSPPRLAELARLQVAAGDEEGAGWSVEKALAQDPKLLSALTTQGELYLRARRITEAEAIAAQLKALHPETAEGEVLEGDALALRGNPAQAADAYAAAVAKTPSPSTVFRLYHARVRAGARDQALRELKDWVASRPEDFAARRLLGVGLIEAGRLDEARQEHERLLAALPDDVSALNNLAWVYGQTGDPRALDLARRAQALAPESATVLDTLGWVLVRRGQPAEGLKYLREAQVRAAADPAVRYHLAVALHQLGRSAEALSAVEEALRLGDGFLEADEARALRSQLTPSR
jgi:putative PEP-CTERM system TPR-repeat lipoprotein